MSSEIRHLQLKFAFFHSLNFFNGEWTFGESNNSKSFQIWWISETKGANEAKVDQTTEMYFLLSDPFI